MAKRDDPWAWAWPWTSDDAEPDLPVRGVPGGWRDPWSVDADIMAMRAEAETEARDVLAALVKEREAAP